MANGLFTPGTGTLKSTDLINAFMELALLIQTEERVSLANEAVLTTNSITVPDNVQITADLNGDTATVNIPALPIQTVLASGSIKIDAVDYLAPIEAVAPAVDASLTVTGSDLTKTNKVQALLELAQLIQQDEALDAELANNLTMSINLDGVTATITGTFAMTPSVNAHGKIEFNMTNYLA
jgi:hypothetical protein